MRSAHGECLHRPYRGRTASWSEGSRFGLVDGSRASRDESSSLSQNGPRPRKLTFPAIEVLAPEARRPVTPAPASLGPAQRQRAHAPARGVGAGIGDRRGGGTPASLRHAEDTLFRAPMRRVADYARVRIQPLRVLLRPRPRSSAHLFNFANRSSGTRLAGVTGSG